MKKIFTKKTLLWGFSLLALTVVFFSFGNGLFAEEVGIEIQNPTGTPEITSFFENVMSRLLNIIAYVAVLFIVIGGIMYIISGMGGGNESLKKSAQNTLAFAIIGLALAAAGPSFLKEIKTVVLGPGQELTTNIASTPSLVEIVRRALSFLLSIVGILAIISLVIGGIMYVFAAGSVDIAKRATKTITYSLLGILVSGTALIIVKKIAELIR